MTRLRQLALLLLLTCAGALAWAQDLLPVPALTERVIDQTGTLSINRRKRYADRVQDKVLDAIEEAVARAMKGLPLGDEED